MAERIKVKDVAVAEGKTVTIWLNPETGNYEARLEGIRGRGWEIKQVSRKSLRDIERTIDDAYGRGRMLKVMTDYGTVTLIGAEKGRYSWSSPRGRTTDSSLKEGPFFELDEALLAELDEARTARKKALAEWDLKITDIEKRRKGYTLDTLKEALAASVAAPELEAEPVNG